VVKAALFFDIQVEIFIKNTVNDELFLNMVKCKLSNCYFSWSH